MLFEIGELGRCEGRVGGDLVKIVDGLSFDSEVGGAVFVTHKYFDSGVFVPLPVVVVLGAFIEKGEFEVVLLGGGEDSVVDVRVASFVGSPPVDEEGVDAGSLGEFDVPLGDGRIGAVVESCEGIGGRGQGRLAGALCCLGQGVSFGFGARPAGPGPAGMAAGVVPGIVVGEEEGFLRGGFGGGSRCLGEKEADGGDSECVLVFHSSISGWLPASISTILLTSTQWSGTLEDGREEHTSYVGLFTAERDGYYGG